MFGHNRQSNNDRYGDQYFQQYEECRHRLPLLPARVSETKEEFFLT
jgi:hypothetical protein